MSDTLTRRGWLVLGGWDGVSFREVSIIGETPKRWRIQALERTKLAGRDRWLEAGETTLVPRRAVRFEEPPR